MLDGIYRTDDTPIHVAVREALANCLSNADFLLSGSVVIRKYPDKIVFSNPGTIRLGKKQMLRGGESQPRNKLILNMLNYIGIGDRRARRKRCPEHLQNLERREFRRAKG